MPVRFLQFVSRYPIRICSRVQSGSNFRPVFATVSPPICSYLRLSLRCSHYLSCNVLGIVDVLLVCFRLLNASVCSGVKVHLFCFFESNFLRISVCAGRFSIYFDRYWIAPKKDFNPFSFFGTSVFVIAPNLSCSGLIPF